MLYQHHNNNYTNLNEYYSLAGYNLIFKAWQKNNFPICTGWHVSAEDLIQIHTNHAETYDTRRLLVDFHPSSTRRIGIIEILEIYIFSYGIADNQYVSWSPMMLRLRDVFYQEYQHDISENFRGQTLQQFPAPNEGEDFVEFLYLNGTDNGWNWGRNGMTNAAFLYGDARYYFRDYF